MPRAGPLMPMAACIRSDRRRPFSASSYWPGWDIARGVVAWNGSNSAGGWGLGGYGGLHPFGGAPAVAAAGYWSGGVSGTSLRGPKFGPGTMAPTYTRLIRARLSVR